MTGGTVVLFFKGTGVGVTVGGVGGVGVTVGGGVTGDVVVFLVVFWKTGIAVDTTYAENWVRCVD